MIILQRKRNVQRKTSQEHCSIRRFFIVMISLHPSLMVSVSSASFLLLLRCYCGVHRYGHVQHLDSPRHWSPTFLSLSFRSLFLRLKQSHLLESRSGTKLSEMSGTCNLKVLDYGVSYLASQLVSRLRTSNSNITKHRNSSE